MNKKLLSFGITSMVLIILVLAGPAFAYIVSLNVLDDEVYKGEDVEFVANVGIGEDEFVDVQNLKLNINGGESLSCLFDVNGNEISGCEGVEIELISLPEYEFGYGYNGYNNGNMSYNIVVHSNELEVGEYSSELVLNVAGNEEVYPGSDFEVLDHKVTICHKAGKKQQTLSVDYNAVPAHLAHGDYLGACQ
jgi:hypothetical protein